MVNTTRRTAFKELLAAGTLPLFNIGCAGFGGEKTDSAVANAHAGHGYRKGWNPFEA